MRRLLVIGNKIPRLPSIEWQQCGTHNVLDYQGLLCDWRKYYLVPSDGSFARTLDTYLRSGHPVYLILPEVKDLLASQRTLPVLPYLSLTVIQIQGSTLRPDTPPPPFQAYVKALRGHEFVFEPKILQGYGQWQSTVVDNIGRAVCGRFGDLLVFHPPTQGRENLAYKTIIEDFRPDFDEPEAEPEPQWAAALVATLPGVAEIESRIREFGTEIAGLRERLAAERGKREEVAKWAQMIWLDGIALQRRVQEALAFIGIPTTTDDPTGHSQDLRIEFEGREFVFEVTGSIGSIGIEKGRQLLQWVLDSKDPASAKGILIANAFRKEPPNNRPPNRDQRIFVKELEDLAVRYHLALVDVRHLFRLVSSKLGGRNPDVTQLCKHLSLDGVVELHLP